MYLVPEENALELWVDLGKTFSVIFPHQFVTFVSVVF